jgi:hypothetical protein
MGPALIICIGCFLAWCSVSMIRRGYFVGKVIDDPARSKRYYRAGRPLEFWALSGGGLLLAAVLIAWALIRSYRD